MAVSNPNGVNLHKEIKRNEAWQDWRFKPQRGKFTLIGVFLFA